PCLSPSENADKQSDIDICFGELPKDVRTLSSEFWKSFSLAPDEEPYLVINKLAVGEYFQFLYSSGEEFIFDKKATSAWCTSTSGDNEGYVVLYLIGPVLGFMLRLRGTVCLHASGVIIKNEAIAIAGVSGSGKSTLAAAFVGAGFPMLTDDIMPLKISQYEKPTAVSGYPRISLYPNSYKNIKGISHNLPRIAEDADKCFIEVIAKPDVFHKEETSLKVIYLLDWNDTDILSKHDIQTLTPARSVSLLAANTYRNELLDPDIKMDEFIFLSKLVEKVPVRRLKPIDDIHMMPSLIETILDDCSAI
ncbi:MAG: hypothetical protein ACI9XC_001878, partial [Gammaproteobacteria bacterium]